MSDREEALEAMLMHWRGLYGDEGAVMVAAGVDPTEEQLEAICTALAPIVTEPSTIVIAVNDGSRPTFASTQRRYQKVEVSEMLPDPANATEYTDQHTPEALSKVGAWRWKIVAKHKDAILPLIQGRRTIDFGGMAGPVGYGSIIVDQGSKEYPALYDVPGEVETIFTSHTLEHVRDVGGLIRAMGDKLVRGGHLVAVVPSWQFEYLRAENYPHHHHTFCLHDAGCAYQEIDSTILGWANCAPILTDDDGESILVIARKR